MTLPCAIWKPPWARAVSSPWKAQRLSFRSLSQLRPPPPPPFPVVNTCPSPTCSCADTPTGLDIDYKTPLSGTMPAYNQHVVICTGKDDWPSRIEDGKTPGFFGQPDLAHFLKSLLGPMGSLHDPYRNVMITHSSFPLDPSMWLARGFYSSVYLFPNFQYVPAVPKSPQGVEPLAREFLLGSKQVDLDDDATAAGRLAALLHKINLSYYRRRVQEVTDVIILICGHGGRDQRCGVMGPLLGSEFLRLLADRRVDTSGSAGRGFTSVADTEDGTVRARVGLVSHIGGHAFAGNVIIYVPPSFTVDGKRSPLAGKGIWYGRVEPKHVEGIIEETIMKGIVIADLFRGGIEQGGKILRL